MSTKKIFLVSSLVACAVMSVKPLSETAKNIIAITGGAAAGVGAGFATKSVCENNRLNGPFKPIAATAVGIGSGALTWYALDMMLFNLTPPGRVFNAAKIIANAENDFFVGARDLHERAVIEGVYASFGTNWPLVLARTHILNLSGDLDYAHELLDMAFNEALGQSQYYDLCQKCKSLKARIPALKERIVYSVNTISKDPSYKEQSILYEKHVEAERQRVHEKNMQAWQQWHDSIEKNKEREFKEKIVNKINQPGRPTSININV